VIDICIAGAAARWCRADAYRQNPGRINIADFLSCGAVLSLMGIYVGRVDRIEHTRRPAKGADSGSAYNCEKTVEMPTTDNRRATQIPGRSVKSLQTARFDHPINEAHLHRTYFSVPSLIGRRIDHLVNARTCDPPRFKLALGDQQNAGIVYSCQIAPHL